MLELSFTPFAPADLRRLTLQPGQREIEGYLATLDADILTGGAHAWTLSIGGVVVGCGGLVPKWRGVAAAWSTVGAVPRRAWPSVTGFVRAQLDQALAEGNLHRIEASVRSDHAAGHRWAERLGFTLEGRARAYDPFKVDHDLYAMVPK